MANYQIKLVLRPELVLRSSSYPKGKVTHYVSSSEWHKIDNNWVQEAQLQQRQQAMQT